jgi:hypothetical protein
MKKNIRFYENIRKSFLIEYEYEHLRK